MYYAWSVFKQMFGAIPENPLAMLNTELGALLTRSAICKHAVRTSCRFTDL